MDIMSSEEQGLGNYSSWRQTSCRLNLGGLRSVPAWEKRFCATIGLVPWRKLLAAKKYMDIYPDVVGWNDAAAEEAFQNAKTRYWAQISGLDCDIELPDPDIYIDKLDWDAEIEPDDLSLDSVSDSESAESRTAVQEEPSSVLDSQPVFCCNYGWDSIEEEADDANSQRWRNPKHLNKAFDCNAGADDWGAFKVEQDLDGSRGWYGLDTTDVGCAA